MIAGTGVAQKLPKDADKLVEDMNKRIACLSFFYRVTEDFTYSMDETFVWFMPIGGAYTFAPVGSNQVNIYGGDDKSGYTASVTCKPTGRSKHDLQITMIEHWASG